MDKSTENNAPLRQTPEAGPENMGSPEAFRQWAAYLLDGHHKFHQYDDAFDYLQEQTELFHNLLSLLCNVNGEEAVSLLYKVRDCCMDSMFKEEKEWLRIRKTAENMVQLHVAISRYGDFLHEKLYCLERLNAELDRMKTLSNSATHITDPHS